jgi:hypothetical protein
MIAEPDRASVTHNFPGDLQPLENCGDEGIIGEIRELRRQMRSRDDRVPGARSVQPCECTQHAILELGDVLDQHRHPPPAARGQFYNFAAFAQNRECPININKR